MQLLLDTHLILWWQGARARVPKAALDLIEATEDAVYVSRASLWEIAIKVNRENSAWTCRSSAKKLPPTVSPGCRLRMPTSCSLRKLPVLLGHKNPFDRLLIAQSASEPLVLLTADATLGQYGDLVRVV